MDEGTLIMCGLKKDAVVESVDIVASQFTRGSRIFKLINDYDTDNVSKKSAPDYNNELHGLC